MRVLKRPMFRRGGEVGGGITSGLRNNYAEGTSARERLLAAYDQMPAQTVDPIAKLLITGGLRGLSETGGGSTLANLATAFTEPTNVLFDDISKQDLERRKLALTGTTMDIEQDQAMDLAKLKQKTGTGLQKDFSPQRAYEDLLKSRTESAGKLTSFQKPNIEQAYPRATSEYDVYVMRNLRATDDPQGKKVAAGNMGFVPFDQKTGRFDYNKMIAGGYYYDPRPGVKSFIIRKPGIEGQPDQFFRVDPYSFKETLIES
jgi:hypothetical protein